MVDSFFGNLGNMNHTFFAGSEFNESTEFLNTYYHTLEDLAFLEICGNNLNHLHSLIHHFLVRSAYGNLSVISNIYLHAGTGNDFIDCLSALSDNITDFFRINLYGNDLGSIGSHEQYLAGRLMGADAGIGGTYGAMPELYLKLDELIGREEIKKAQKLQIMVTDFIYRLCSFPSMYGACKTIIRMDGVDIGEPRLPFLPVDEKDPAIIQLYKDIRGVVEETRNW